MAQAVAERILTREARPTGCKFHNHVTAVVYNLVVFIAIECVDQVPPHSGDAYTCNTRHHLQNSSQVPTRVKHEGLAMFLGGWRRTSQLL
jgi:hypothetical protein